MDDFKVQVNLKLGTGYDATLINLRGETSAEVLGYLSEIASAAQELTRDIAVVQQAANAVNGAAAANTAAPAEATNKGTPPPSASTPSCKHGQMAWKSGVSKVGKPYSGHYCPQPFNSPDKCPPVYAN